MSDELDDSNNNVYTSNTQIISSASSDNKPKNKKGRKVGYRKTQYNLDKRLLALKKLAEDPTADNRDRINAINAYTALAGDKAKAQNTSEIVKKYEFTLITPKDISAPPNNAMLVAPPSNTMISNVASVVTKDLFSDEPEEVKQFLAIEDK